MRWSLPFPRIMPVSVWQLIAAFVDQNRTPVSLIFPDGPAAGCVVAALVVRPAPNPRLGALGVQIQRCRGDCAEDCGSPGCRPDYALSQHSDALLSFRTPGLPPGLAVDGRVNRPGFAGDSNS